MLRWGRGVMLGAVVGLAALPAAETTRSVPGPATVADLDWLRGCWTVSQGGAQTTECWSDAAGGAMLGFGRTVKEGHLVFYEFFRIAVDGGAPAYFAYPEGQPPTPFRLKSLLGGRAVFENLEHDFPQRVIYEQRADGTLAARVEGSENGRERAEEWLYRPIPFPAAER